LGISQLGNQSAWESVSSAARLVAKLAFIGAFLIASACSEHASQNDVQSHAQSVEPLSTAEETEIHNASPRCRDARSAPAIRVRWLDTKVATQKLEAIAENTTDDDYEIEVSLQATGPTGRMASRAIATHHVPAKEEVAISVPVQDMPISSTGLATRLQLRVRYQSARLLALAELGRANQEDVGPLRLGTHQEYASDERFATSSADFSALVARDVVEHLQRDTALATSGEIPAVVERVLDSKSGQGVLHRRQSEPVSLSVSRRADPATDSIEHATGGSGGTP
jgi:hypothetical protein